MNKVKYVLGEIYPELTPNKIYDVIAHHKSSIKKENDWITILNDNNILYEYRLYTYIDGFLEKVPIFNDITEYRNDVIDGILM